MEPITIVGASIIAALAAAGPVAAPVTGAAIAAGPVGTAGAAALATAGAGSAAAGAGAAGSLASNPYTAVGVQNAGAVAYNQAAGSVADAYNPAASQINGMLPPGVPPLPMANR